MHVYNKHWNLFEMRVTNTLALQPIYKLKSNHQTLNMLQVLQDRRIRSNGLTMFNQMKRKFVGCHGCHGCLSISKTSTL